MLHRIKLLNYFYKYKRKLGCNWSQSTQFHRNKCDKLSEPGCVAENRLKVLFFGTDNFSLPSLKALHRCRLPSLGVVTSFKSPANCVRRYAVEQGLPLYRWPVSVEDCQKYDLGVVVSFGHLLPELIIKAFPLGMINVHASLLPRWRGAAPIIYAIMNGDTTTGVSIMKIEPKRFDVGDILAQHKVAIEEKVFMPELHERLANEGANLLLDVLSGYPKSFTNGVKQNAAHVTLAPKITPSVTEVNWAEMDADQIYRRYRALFSFKQLISQFHGRIVQFINIKLPKCIHLESMKKVAAPPGSFIYMKDAKCLLVRCAGNSFVEVHQLRMEGKKSNECAGVQ